MSTLELIRTLHEKYFASSRQTCAVLAWCVLWAAHAAGMRGETPGVPGLPAEDQPEAALQTRPAGAGSEPVNACSTGVCIPQHALQVLSHQAHCCAAGRPILWCRNDRMCHIACSCSWNSRNRPISSVHTEPV